MIAGLSKTIATGKMLFSRCRQKPWLAVFVAMVLMTAIFITVACHLPLHRGGDSAASNKECVLLLHGFCRSSLSMYLVEQHLKRSGYDVININYASTQKSIDKIAAEDLGKVVLECERNGYPRIHMVTHSLGAIVARTYLQGHDLPEGSRVVMLAPPNQGSELMDWAQHRFPNLIRIAGPSAMQLGTQNKILTDDLKPIAPEVGVIIGNRSWNPYFSTIIPGSDDGKVSVERAKLSEMRDFWVAPCNHTTILLNTRVQRQIAHFLEKGAFDHAPVPLRPLKRRFVHPIRNMPASALDALTRQR